MTSVDLSTYTTFKTAASAAALVEISDTAQLTDLSEQLRRPIQNFIVLGSGSNVLFADNYEGLVIVNRLRGKQILAEDDKHVVIKIAAGEIWHDIVCEMSQKGYYGLENLALIPGTVGAAPVQNIGAYAVEVSDFIESVQVFDMINGEYDDILADDCDFAYRDSLFKREACRQRYLITAVTLRLKKTFSPVLSYQGLMSDNDDKLTANALLQRVISVRQNKLPDPAQLPNAGSFFKNPLVSRQQLKQLQVGYPDIPYFKVNDRQVKIPAAWLIETAGFKGIVRENGAGVYDKHALILVNYGQAHGRNIYDLACDIIKQVNIQFAISLSPEVRVIR